MTGCGHFAGRATHDFVPRDLGLGQCIARFANQSNVMAAKSRRFKICRYGAVKLVDLLHMLDNRRALLGVGQRKQGIFKQSIGNRPAALYGLAKLQIDTRQ